MASVIVEEYGKDPFLILISCLLSLRTRDVISLPVSQALFAHAKTPQELVKIPIPKLEKIIHATGFYRNKARVLHNVSVALIKNFKGKVPSSLDDLLSLPGVGRKTANLVLAQAFDSPAICVDTHVHRLANQLGMVHTKTPEQTELALQKIVPKKYWIELNRLLVTWGQQIPRKKQIVLLEKLMTDSDKS